MKVYRAAAMQEADRIAPERGVPLARLMRHAGEGVARAAVREFPEVREWHVLTGPGNNGGDGWVCALELLKRGRPARVWNLPGGVPAPGPAAAARDAFLRAGGRIGEITDGTDFPVPSRAGVIDALFGSGLSRPLAGLAAAFVAELSGLAGPVVAVDVPSGLVSDLALSPGPFLAADLTVALAGYKPAHLFEPARSACGRIVLLDIGFPEGLPDECSDIRLLSEASVAPFLPPPEPGGHKYGAGTVCLVAGSERYRGAAELAARGAWRSGAGLVTLVSDGVFSAAWPETIFEPHDWAADWPPPGLSSKRAAALVVGPGLDPAAGPALPAIASWAPGPLILDAAALEPGLLRRLQPLPQAGPPVLTPHAGEAERLLQEFLPERAGLAQTDPLEAAAQLTAELGAITVLKGPATVIAGLNGELAVSDRGHPALATGGTGDVLAGVIGAVLARTPAAETAFHSVCAAVFLHGLAGELAAERNGTGLIAGDVAEALPAARMLLSP